LIRKRQDKLRKSFKLTKLVSVWLVFIICVNCSQSNSINNQSKSDLLLGIAVTVTSDGDFDRSFSKVVDARMKMTNMALQWDDLEKKANVFGSEPNFLQIADFFYPAKNLQLALEINPIDTVKKRVPKDLADKSFDDPKLIQRFKALLDWSFKQIPNPKLTSLTIGNEVDIYLGDDKVKWKQFEKFFIEVSRYAKQLRKDIKVGTKITYGGLIGKNREFASKIIKQSDVIMPTYYPVDEAFKAKKPTIVGEDFSLLLKLYPNQEIYFLEIGYPSSSLCGSSEAAQAEFIKETFKAWDASKSSVKILNFTFLTDLPETTKKELVTYYGLSNPCFAEFLGTLGLRTQDDQDKLAYKQLKIEAERRNF
jgi:hypothetical protein